MSDLLAVCADDDPPFRILLAFSGIKAALASATGFNDRVSECRSAAAALLEELDQTELEPILGNISQDGYRSVRETILLSGEWLSSRFVKLIKLCSNYSCLEAAPSTWHHVSVCGRQHVSCASLTSHQPHDATCRPSDVCKAS